MLYSWFFPTLSRTRAENILKTEVSYLFPCGLPTTVEGVSLTIMADLSGCIVEPL